MARGFQADQHGSAQGREGLEQLIKPGARVLNREGTLHQLPFLIQQGDSMFAFSDIDPTVVHHGLLATR